MFVCLHAMAVRDDLVFNSVFGPFVISALKPHGVAAATADAHRGRPSWTCRRRCGKRGWNWP